MNLLKPIPGNRRTIPVSFPCLLSILLLQIGGGAAYPAGAALSAFHPLAHFEFNDNGDDRLGKSPAMFLRNVSYSDGALYLNGNYQHSAPDGYITVASIAGFSYSAFTVAVDFFPLSFLPNGSTRRLNILTGGTAYRWLSLHSVDGHLALTLNNVEFTHVFRETQLATHAWQQVICAVDVNARKIRTFLNGVKLEEIVLDSLFSFDVVGTPSEERDKLFSFTNYSNGHVFYGFVDNLMVFGQAVPDSEISGIVTTRVPNFSVSQPPGRKILICWPEIASGYVLQFSTNLGGVWNNFPGPNVFTNRGKCVELPLPSIDRAFFRLSRPLTIPCFQGGTLSAFSANFDDDTAGGLPGPCTPLEYGPAGACLRVSGPTGSARIVDSTDIGSKALEIRRGSGLPTVVTAELGDLGTGPYNSGTFYFGFKGQGSEIPRNLISSHSFELLDGAGNLAFSLRLYDGAYHYSSAGGHIRLSSAYDLRRPHCVNVAVDLNARTYTIRVNNLVVGANLPLLHSAFNAVDQVRISTASAILEASPSIYVIDNIRVTK